MFILWQIKIFSLLLLCISNILLYIQGKTIKNEHLIDWCFVHCDTSTDPLDAICIYKAGQFTCSHCWAGLDLHTKYTYACQ